MYKKNINNILKVFVIFVLTFQIIKVQSDARIIAENSTSYSVNTASVSLESSATIAHDIKDLRLGGIERRCNLITVNNPKKGEKLNFYAQSESFQEIPEIRINHKIHVVADDAKIPQKILKEHKSNICDMINKVPRSEFRDIGLLTKVFEKSISIAPYPYTFGHSSNDSKKIFIYEFIYTAADLENMQTLYNRKRSAEVSIVFKLEI